MLLCQFFLPACSILIGCRNLICSLQCHIRICLHNRQMDIENKISELFRAKDVEDRPKDTNSVMDLKKIENQLNLHMKNKQGLKYKKISLVYNHAYDKESFSQVIDQELNTKMANKKWKGLPMFMKWKAIQDYLSKNNITDETYIQMVRKKLVENTLEVECHDHIITKIM